MPTEQGGGILPARNSKSMRKRAKVDSNQAQVVEAFKALGWRVQSTATIGAGFPDLVVQRGHDTRLVEVKQPKGTLTEDQRRFMETGGWIVHVVRSIADVEAL